MIVIPSSFKQATYNSSTTQNPQNSSAGFFAIVRDIILDETHPEWEQRGGIHCKGAIKYDSIRGVNSLNKTQLNIARPFNKQLINIPVIGEIVWIILAPSPQVGEYATDFESYYISTVNIWNNLNHNTTVIGEENFSFKGTFKEKDLGEIKEKEGDTVFNGRNGNSLFFTSDIKNQEPLSYLIHLNEIENKTAPVDLTYDLISTGVILTGKSKIPSLPTLEFPVEIKSNPLSPSRYEQEQVVLKGTRIFLHSTSESIISYTTQDIINIGKNIYNKASETFLVNAEKIRLGDKAAQPLIKGKEFVKVMEDIFTQIYQVGTILKQTVSTPSGTVIPQVLEAGIRLENLSKEAIQTLQKTLSTKSYTE